MKKQIVAMGDGLWDLFPDGPRFGGATANYACHCSILGARAPANMKPNHCQQREV